MHIFGGVRTPPGIDAPGPNRPKSPKKSSTLQRFLQIESNEKAGYQSWPNV